MHYCSYPKCTYFFYMTYTWVILVFVLNIYTHKYTYVLFVTALFKQRKRFAHAHYSIFPLTLCNYVETPDSVF